MATQTIAIIYNSGVANSLWAAMILKLKYIAQTVTMVDVIGKAEVAMTSAINTITANTQDKVYVTTVVDASYAAKGQLSTDVNIVALELKIKAASVAPYNVPVELGEYDSNNAPPMRAWLECYPTISWPNVVRYLSDNYFPRMWTTADSAASTSITDAGTFTPSLFDGWYVYIVSATTGAGQVRKIVSSTVNALTVAAWDVTPTGTIVYGICEYEAEALRFETIKCYTKGLLWDLTKAKTREVYYRLLDYGTFDPSYNSINTGALVSPITDKDLLETVCAEGLKIYATQIRYAEVTTLNT